MKYELDNQLDATDRLIIRELIKDARQPFSQLAEKLGVSNSLVHQRVRKLQEVGVLSSATFRLQPDSLGYDTCAFVSIKLTEAKAMYGVVEALNQIPEVVECTNVAGRYAIMIKIYTINNSHLRDIVYDKIQSIDGVEETNTVVAFETNFIRDVPV